LGVRGLIRNGDERGHPSGGFKNNDARTHVDSPRGNGYLEEENGTERRGKVS